MKIHKNIYTVRNLNSFENKIYNIFLEKRCNFEIGLYYNEIIFASKFEKHNQRIGHVSDWAISIYGYTVPPTIGVAHFRYLIKKGDKKPWYISLEKFLESSMVPKNIKKAIIFNLDVFK